MKNSSQILSFECGFSGKGSRKYFSLRFFNLALLFLIFDVEISLLLIVPFISSGFSLKGVLFLLLFLIILVLGLLVEWALGVIGWVE